MGDLSDVIRRFENHRVMIKPGNTSIKNLNLPFLWLQKMNKIIKIIIKIISQTLPVIVLTLHFHSQGFSMPLKRLSTQCSKKILGLVKNVSYQ